MKLLSIKSSPVVGFVPTKYLIRYNSSKEQDTEKEIISSIELEEHDRKQKNMVSMSISRKIYEGEKKGRSGNYCVENVPTLDAISNGSLMKGFD